MNLFKKSKFGYVLVILATVFSLSLWILRMPLVDRFSDFFSVVTSLGQIFGILGMVLFAITIILSSRLKVLEKYFGGLNKVYSLHHFLGGLALVFLLFHPIVLVIKFIKISLLDAALFLLPGSNIAITFGIFALLLMILLLIFTFFVSFPYKTWKITHKFLGLAFFFAILHIFFVPSDVSLYLPLKIYMVILVLFAVLVLLYRTVFPNAVVKKFIYTVDQVNKLNSSVIEIVMSPKGEKMNFEPGQYIFIGFNSKEQKEISKEVHPFTISSGALDEKLKITVKSLGKYTEKLQNLQSGAEATIEGPFGVFSYLESINKNQVWIAGGIGITPFLSMAKSLDKNYKIDLYYCVKAKDELVFEQDIRKLETENSNFKLIPICSDVDGRINVKTIGNLSGNILEKDFFLCGPPAMMKSIRSELLANGVSNKNIHSEEFSY
jgi:predicted ferric reductase